MKKTKKVSAGQERVIDTHQNQDKVLKESFSLFKGGSLAFLDQAFSGEITDVLGTEITETMTKKAYSDSAMKLIGDKGIHSEWEADINKADMMRFASYNIDLSRIHGIDFTTVIITTKKPDIAVFKNSSITFKPKIINLKTRDADKILTKINRSIKAGKYDSINELELIYLPLYGSKSGKSTADLLDTAIKLAPKVVVDDRMKLNKLHDLLLLLVSTFISDEELKIVMEANMLILEENRAVRVLKEMGIEQGREQGREQGIILGREQVARNMLQLGDDVTKVSQCTGLDISQITKLQSELQSRK